jgi:hypothetical protein
MKYSAYDMTNAAKNKQILTRQPRRIFLSGTDSHST